MISHTSTARYKKTEKSSPDIARELSVDAIIEGSVARSADRVRITVQLISGSQDKNLWAKSYERELEDSLTLQSEVASAIAGEVRARLKPSEESRLTAARPLNLKSLDAYFHGTYHLGRFGTGVGLEEAERAIDQLQEAIALDPGFAQAYVKIAEVYEREGNLLPSDQPTSAWTTSSLEATKSEFPRDSMRTTDQIREPRQPDREHTEELCRRRLFCVVPAFARLNGPFPSHSCFPMQTELPGGTRVWG